MEVRKRKKNGGGGSVCGSIHQISFLPLHSVADIKVTICQGPSFIFQHEAMELACGSKFDFLKFRLKRLPVACSQTLQLLDCSTRNWEALFEIFEIYCESKQR